MSILDRWRRRDSPPALWRGVYESFADVPGSIEGHASRDWHEALAAEMSAVRRGEWSDDFAIEHDALRLLVIALGGARILDYGGGVGQTYEFLRRVLPAGVHVSYELIEVPSVAELASRFHSDSDVIIRSELGDTQTDIVFVKSVLQYIEDHQTLLTRLFACRAKFVILEKFSGVAAPSYVTAQLNVTGTPIPYRFISFSDVFSIAVAAGYDRLVWRRLPRTYDQSEFPQELRMGQASTLVFGRRGD